MCARATLAFLAALAAACSSPPSVPASRFAHAAEVERELTTLEIPSAAVAVLQAGGGVFAQGYGQRTPEGGEVTPQTVFRLGSVTKVLTGMALLQLRDAGQLTLDDPVALYIPELAAVLSPPGQPPVTVRHLVTHTSGIPSVDLQQADYTRSDRGPTEAELLEAVVQGGLEFPPGSEFRYSNNAMALAGVVVARASDEPYRQYMHRHLLEPLGMRTAAWEAEAVPPERLATGHLPDGTPAPSTWKLGAVEPAGGLYTSLEELLPLALLQLGIPLPGTAQVLAPTSVAESQEDAPLPGPFGINWVVTHVPGVGRMVGHTGSTVGYSASMVLLPDQRAGAIVLMSSSRYEDSDCLAVALALSAATGAPPTSCSKAPQEVSAPLTRGAEHVLAVLQTPSPDVLLGALSPTFLAAIPTEQVQQTVRGLTTVAGACTQAEVVEASGLTGVVRVHCEKQAVRAHVAVEAAPPHLLKGLKVTLEP